MALYTVMMYQLLEPQQERGQVFDFQVLVGLVRGFDAARAQDHRVHPHLPEIRRSPTAHREAETAKAHRG